MKKVSYGVAPYYMSEVGAYILLGRPKGHTEWGFIKGGIDSGESPKQCAQRELLEETNISVSTNSFEELFFQINKKKNIGIFLVPYSSCDVSKIKLAPRELEEIRFFNINDNIEINKNQIKILKEIKEHFGNLIKL